MAVKEAACLVARFLESHGYGETLEAFIQEANLPRTITSAIRDNGSLTIEKVLEEKHTFDRSLQFEKLGDDDAANQWHPRAPAVANSVATALPSSANILHVSFGSFEARGASRDSSSPFLLATTADRRLNILNLPSCTLRDSLTVLHDSPILSCQLLRQRYLLTSSMSGRIVISDSHGAVLASRRDHSKYVVQLAAHEHDDASIEGSGKETTWIATAGWDGQVHLYKLRVEGGATPRLDAPFATISLPTNPEALLFVRHPDDGQTILIVTRRDSTYLYYYSITADGVNLLGKQNLAPHANSWAHMTPSSIALSPIDPTLLAVATSAIPHMKLLIVRLMMPPVTQASSIAEGGQALSSLVLEDGEDQGRTPASQARAALALQDRETAAILIHCTTLAPQTAYSTPALSWRPDGSGIWVNSDDGVIRGIETSTGKVVASLKGHEPGSKIRCLCSGWVEKGEKKEEWLVSGGFDQKMIIWKPQV